jgi:uncharacterized membrane protein YfcA
MLLVLALSLLLGPAAALASTAPALLLGNVHRFALFRKQIDARVAYAYAAGAIPGSITGGLACAALPEWALHALMAVMAILAVLRSRGVFEVRLRTSWMVPAGFVIGALAATTGGAGLLAGPVLMAAGLKGDAYVATSAAASAATHAGRIIAYGAGGLFTGETPLIAAVLAAAILAGNVEGLRIRRRLAATTPARLELGALVGCVALSIIGLGR